MVEDCLNSLVDDPDGHGHYFTIWAPRQTGKTWLTWQVKKEIESRYGDRFLVGSMSVQGVVIKKEEPEEAFLAEVPILLWETFKLEIEEAPRDWKGFRSLFSIDKGLFDRPVILFIDEFDSLPVKIIDLLVGLFRDMYQKRNYYHLHGLALIGVRAALGVDSDRGSPFNIQRALHIPNLTRDEVVNYTNGAQHPQFGRINNPKFDKGDFIFILADGAVRVETAIQPGKQKEKPRTGSLRVATKPSKAEIFIDGAKEGTSPSAFTKLTPGKDIEPKTPYSVTTKGASGRLLFVRPPRRLNN